MIRTLLIAIDESPRAADVLRTGMELGTLCGARIHVLRVVTVPPEFPAAGAGAQPDRLEAVMAQRAREDVTALVARTARAGAAVDLVVRSGEPWPTIGEVADELGADMIVVGSHGYRGWDRVLGTTTLDVVKHSSRNVLVVRSAPPA